MLAELLRRRRASGATSIRVLDAGCGPGTWLRRVVAHAQTLGFTSISARGFDVSQRQIRSARFLSREQNALPGVSLTFDVADLEYALRERDASVDLTLCLYSVLSHLPVASLAEVCSEFARVTAGHVVATVRPVGSTPTIFVDSIEKARRFQRDEQADWCDIEMENGRRIGARFHLFEAAELRRYFADGFEIEDLRGLDLFHGRFSPDRRWNPASVSANAQLCGELARLEDTFSTNPSFMERAAHLLLVGQRRPGIALQT
ncbi:MAG TPA: class I SAM-dependent methyltransferase [Polyangiaceae bacterium]|nr:class I SAM-dependent methyltransferase [Polyangiaceae bacterium]